MSTFKQLQDKLINFFGALDIEIKNEIKESINDTIWEINNENPRSIHLQESYNITLTQGSTTVTNGIPSDYDHILSIYLIVSGKKNPPLFFLSKQEWNLLRIFDLSNTTPSHYTIWDNTLLVAPPPDSAYSGVVDYYQFDSELTNDGDTCKLTSKYPRWEYLLISGVKSKIYDYLGSDQQMIDKSFIKYQNNLKRFRAWTHRNLNGSPNATRIKGWKEIISNFNVLPPEQLRRY